ncbi:MAG: hypothetical protein WC527_05265 [Candidatus Margulisiibacteriota bacterium]
MGASENITGPQSASPASSSVPVPSLIDRKTPSLPDQSLRPSYKTVLSFLGEVAGKAVTYVKEKAVVEPRMSNIPTCSRKIMHSYLNTDGLREKARTLRPRKT